MVGAALIMFPPPPNCHGIVIVDRRAEILAMRRLQDQASAARDMGIEASMNRASSAKAGQAYRDLCRCGGALRNQLLRDIIKGSRRGMNLQVQS